MINYEFHIAQIHYNSQEDVANYEEVIKKTDELFELGWDDSQINFYRGRAHQMRNEYNDAIKFYKRCGEHNDVYSNWTEEQSVNNLINLYFEIDDFENCIALCQQNKRNSHPDWQWNAYYIAAHCYYLQFCQAARGSSPLTAELDVEGKLIKAEKDILKALEIEPNNIDAFFLAGRIYDKQNNRSKAVFYLEKAAELGDKDASQLLSQF